MAVAENVARQGLNPIEEAHAFVALLEEFEVTQDELGPPRRQKPRGGSNSIRLLNLPDQALALLERRTLTKAHGKALLAEPDHDRRRTLAQPAATESWSVRQLQENIDRGRRRQRRPRRPPADMLAAAGRWTNAIQAHTGHDDLTIRAGAKGFELALGDHDTARATLTRLGIPAPERDEPA